MSVFIDQLKISRDGKQVISLPHLAVEKGQVGLITGPSGSGKTTLLYALSGLIAVDAGKIVIGNIDITALRHGQSDIWRGQHVGFVFQDLHIIPHLLVEQNVKLAGALTGKVVNAEWFKKITNILGLEKLLGRYGYQLSTGEKQRVAIARSIALQPSLLLVDEPTSGLDDQNAKNVQELLLLAAKLANATLLISTHDSRLKSDLSVILNLGESA